mmetsp:Transcript_3085/g.9406  ORF Transcript_3085/g.9406 Transcript_3085/m.9406 type:complete len:355 (-) Transcript_3085:2801-3865(-)
MKRARVRCRKAIQSIFGIVEYRRLAVGAVGLVVVAFALVELLHVDDGRELPNFPGDQHEVVRPQHVRAEDIEAVTGNKVAKGGPKYVAVFVANYGYRDLAMNMVCSLKHLGLSDYVLLSLDDKMHAFATKRGVSSVLLHSNHTKSVELLEHLPEEAAQFGSKEFVRVSLTKTAVVLSLLKRNFYVLFIDVDVALLQDPLPHFAAQSESIVATSDIRFGKDDSRKLNQRVNSGLFLAKPQRQVIEAFEQIARIGAQNNRSQQKAFNWVLCGQYGGIARGRGKLQGNRHCLWQGRKGSVSTKVLSLKQFPNGSGWPTAKAVCVHQNFKQGVQEKIDAMKEMKSWYYDENGSDMCRG